MSLFFVLLVAEFELGPFETFDLPAHIGIPQDSSVHAYDVLLVSAWFVK